MELNEREFSDYTKAYARRIFKHSDGSSDDQRTYDRAAKHLKSKFPEVSAEDVHKELNKHFPAYQTEGLGADLITGTKKVINTLHNFISTKGIGEFFRRKKMMTNSSKGRAPKLESTETKSEESMSIFNQERKEYFLERLNESMGLHGIISDRANDLSVVMGIPPQAIVPQIKALLARKAQQNKKLKESFREFIAEYESVLAENGIEEYDLDEATEYFVEQVLIEEILNEAKTVGNDITNRLGVIHDAYPHHSLEDLKKNLSNPNFKLQKSKEMSNKDRANHAHYSAAYEQLQHAHLHNKVDNGSKSNSTNVSNIQRAVNVARGHVKSADQCLSRVSTENAGVKAAKTGDISHISSGVPNRMHA